MTVELTREQARRIAVRAQLLDAHRPADLDDMVQRLTFLQYDQTAAVAPNADLVAWSRIGPSYRPSELAEGLADRTFVELRGLIRPMEDVALYRAEMASPDTLYEGQRHWVDANDGFRHDILALLDVDGPVPQSAIPDTSQVPWGSSGWSNNRNVGKMLDCLVVLGEIALADRDGRDRMFDLARRVYPDDVVPLGEARRLRAERWLRSMGLAHKRRADMYDPADLGVPARVEGVRGLFRLDAAQLDQPFEGRTALLSPLDQLIFDRRRMAELFEFDYNLEMYKPPAQRRWGYFALPILSGDRLIGKLDATTDRKRGVLRVDAIHEDSPFDAATSRAVLTEIHSLAQWLRLGLDLPG